MTDIGATIPEVPFKFFQENILPQLTADINVAKIVKSLEERGDIQGKRWKAFPNDPCDCKNEPLTFNGLGDVLKAIIESAGLDESALVVEYLSKPSMTPLCDYVRKDHRPDAFMLVRQASNPWPTDAHPYWRDICCPAEFKLKNRAGDLTDVSNDFGNTAVFSSSANRRSGCNQDMLEHVPNYARRPSSSIRPRV